MNNGEILDYPRGHGTAEERHHEIVEVRMHAGVLGDTESEIDGGNDTHWPSIHPIRTAVEVGKVRKPGMIWESQVEREPKWDTGPPVIVEVDKNSHICRGGDLQVNQHLPNIACVFLLEIETP